MPLISEWKGTPVAFASLSDKLSRENIAGALAKSFDDGMVALDKEKDPSGFFHVSDLGKCLRSLYYKRMGKKEFPINVRRKFEAGKDFGQRAVRFVRASGKLFGSAFCYNCKKMYESCVLPKVCDCGCIDLCYCETGVKRTDRKLSGKIDFFVQHRGKAVIVEAKSASTYYRLNNRKNVRDKLSAHIHQGNAYLGVVRGFLRAAERGEGKDKKYFFYADNTGVVLDKLALAQSVHLDSFLLMYEDKNSNDIYPYEFEYDHSMYIDDMVRVKEFFGCLKSGKPPEREQGDLECKYCDYTHECKR